MDTNSVIDVSEYKIGSIKLYTYTATWCGPCRRIKPKVIDIMSKKNYKLIKYYTLEKKEFKERINDFVPFFVITNEDDFHEESSIDSIQTSDEKLLIEFLTKNGIDVSLIPLLDDDF